MLWISPLSPQGTSIRSILGIGNFVYGDSLTSVEDLPLSSEGREYPMFILSMQVSGNLWARVYEIRKEFL